MKALASAAMGLALAAGLAVATPSGAAVIYRFEVETLHFLGGEDDDGGFGQYEIRTGGFTYIAPDFLTGDADLQPGELAHCASPDPETACTHEQFYVDASPLSGAPDRFDAIGFNVGSPDGEANRYYYYPNHAFGAEGVYEDRGGRLTITLAGVPEPGTWAMLFLGFAGMGAVLRVRRRALAA